MSHWHLQRHSEDDDIYVTPALADALDYAAQELNDSAAFEHQRISESGEVGDYEQAFGSFQRSERYASLAADAANVHHQATAPIERRAPLYAVRDEVEYARRVHETGLYVIDRINATGPSGFAVWECDDTACAPEDGEE